jgi:hypothetical protein
MLLESFKINEDTIDGPSSTYVMGEECIQNISQTGRKISLAGPMRRWEHNITMDLKEIA